MVQVEAGKLLLVGSLKRSKLSRRDGSKTRAWTMKTKNSIATHCKTNKPANYASYSHDSVSIKKSLHIISISEAM